MNTKLKAAFALSTLALMAGCARSGSVPVLSSRLPETITRSGNFTEYTLPQSANPFALARGPYSALYLPCGDHVIPYKIYQFVESTGAVHPITVPDPYTYPNSPGGVISVGGATYFFAVNLSQMKNNYLVRVTPTGSFKFSFLGKTNGTFTNIALGADGKLWFSACPDNNCYLGHDYFEAVSTNGTIGPVGQLGVYRGTAITPGPGGNLYLTVVGTGFEPNPAFVYVISTSGVILHKIALPNGSNPRGIVTGSDHNLWITENDIGKIARMTPAGVVTQFSLPLAYAGPVAITDGWDGALWFTENGADKIGRITTTGSITEFQVPTSQAGLFDIVTCPPTLCGVHGGVWFTEFYGNKLGKFNSPL